MNQQPAWFQRVSELPVIGRIALSLGPWGFGGCMTLGVLFACIVLPLLLGGISLFGGALLRPPVVSALRFGSDVEVITETPRPTSTPASTSTPAASATPALTSTPTPGPCSSGTTDPTGDTFNPDTGEQLSDSEVDITEVNTHCQEERMITEVVIDSPDVAALDDYSFAVVIFVFDEEEQQLYRWVFEHHAGQTTMAVVDSVSGQRLDWQTTFNIFAVAQRSIVNFAIPLDQLPEDSPIGLTVQSFHMDASDGDRSSDEVQGLI